jgi:hypothetical protein
MIAQSRQPAMTCHFSHESGTVSPPPSLPHSFLHRLLRAFSYHVWRWGPGPERHPATVFHQAVALEGPSGSVVQSVSSDESSSQFAISSSIFTPKVIFITGSYGRQAGAAGGSLQDRRIRYGGMKAEVWTICVGVICLRSSEVRKPFRQ